MNPIISVRNLQKTYAAGHHALKGLSFDVFPGEFLVIIGLSGSGKTTLLRSLNLLTEVSAGEIYFHDQRIDQLVGKDVLAVRRKLAMIFQNFNLINRYSTLDNVLMGRLATTPVLKSLFRQFSAKDHETALHYLNLMGIADKADERVSQLSGGQQQRVAIARALCQEPEVILADEPVASLDPATCYTVMNYLRKVNQELGITILCNLHFLSLAREFATRVVALRDGQIVFQGSVKEITNEKFKVIYGEEAREVYVE